MDALWIWRQFPRQIASDLSQFHHRRIKQWHRGKMSSYELLELLEHMPEKGAFKTAARGGEYSEEDITWRHIANEIARLRATMHAVHGGQKYDPPVLLTKSQQREELEDLMDSEVRREEFYSFADRSPGRVQPVIDDDSMLEIEA